MDAKQLQRLQCDLTRYLDDVLPDLGRHGRRSWAELYLRGLLLDGRRKSAGAMAERLRRIDVTPLFPSRERHQQRTRCSFVQIALAERAWFVATPLFPVPGNAITNEPGVPLSR